MTTEDIDPDFIEIDNWPTLKAVSQMAIGQLDAVNCVIKVQEKIAKAVDKSAKRLLNSNGRLLYVGAGTSGRIAVQDGVELFPTYGWSFDRMAFFMAGGENALMRAVENAEDDFDDGYNSLINANIDATDILIGVAASGRTPYVLGAIKAAKENGALSLGFSNNPDTALLDLADIGILLDSGAEPVAGSTRMKAGTAQKIALNLFSTALMIKLGGVYNGQMVGMIATNEKLRNRATRIVMSLTNTNEDIASKAVGLANGDLKNAVLIALGVDNAKMRADALLNANGNLRQAIKQLIA